MILLNPISPEIFLLFSIYLFLICWGDYEGVALTEVKFSLEVESLSLWLLSYDIWSSKDWLCPLVITLSTSIGCLSDSLIGVLDFMLYLLSSFPSSRMWDKRSLFKSSISLSLSSSTYSILIPISSISYSYFISSSSVSIIFSIFPIWDFYGDSVKDDLVSICFLSKNLYLISSLLS